MPIDNPAALVEEFKKSGEFDRLRRELLAQFQQDGSYSSLKNRVEEIARQRLTADQTLQYSALDDVHKELTQEVERYPIVERAVADVRVFSDPTFLESMRTSIQKILDEDKKKTLTPRGAGGEQKLPSDAQINPEPIEKVTETEAANGPNKHSVSDNPGLAGRPLEQKLFEKDDDKMKIEANDTQPSETRPKELNNSPARPSLASTPAGVQPVHDADAMEVDSPGERT